jgi:hypothetical protein
MVDVVLRTHVERLLKGDLRLESLTTLFLALRERCDGREAIREIGDFVAHRADRNKGITTEEVRDFFAILQFTIWKLTLPPEPDPLPIYLRELPPCFDRAMLATLKRIDNHTLRNYRLKRNEADQLLTGLLKNNIVVTPEGTRRLGGNGDERHFPLLNCLTLFLVSRPAFDETRLFEEFLATLKSNLLIKNDEIKRFRELKSYLTLYAIAYMHQNSIDLGDGHRSVLCASISTKGNLVIYAKCKANFHGQVRTWCCTIFDTSLDAKAYCDPDIVRDLSEGKEFPIELTTKSKLVKLV